MPSEALQLHETKSKISGRDLCIILDIVELGNEGERDIFLVTESAPPANVCSPRSELGKLDVSETAHFILSTSSFDFWVPHEVEVCFMGNLIPKEPYYSWIV